MTKARRDSLNGFRVSLKRGSRRAAAGLGLVPLVLSAALACAPPEGAETLALRPDTPLTAAAPDGRRFRLAAVAGEARLSLSGEARVAPLGPPDRHGRLPAQIFDASGPVEIVLLREGRVRLAAAAGVPRDCRRSFERAETEAIRAGRGLWAGEGRPVAATDAEALKALEGRFAIVEGRVRSARRQGRTTYVNFGGPGSGALTVTIAERDMPAFREAGLEPAAIRGHMLRVRGIVTIRRGPTIAAAIPEAITIAEPP